MGFIEGILAVIGVLAVIVILAAAYEEYTGGQAAAEQEAAHRRGMEAAARISAAAVDAERALHQAAREEMF